MKKSALDRHIEELEKEIHQRNQGFYDDYVAKYYPKDVKKKNSFIISLSLLLVFIFIATAATVAIVLKRETGKQYLLENEVTVNSTIDELNSIQSDFILTIVDEYSIEKVNRIYDEISNDTLYFKITLHRNDELENAEMVFYVNENYEHNKQLQSVDGTFEIDNVTYTYNVAVNNAEIAWFYNYNATATINKTDIYLMYKETSLTEESNFENFLSQTIKAK